MPLTQPKQTHPIGGDGNCMFRSVSYVMTGSQEHHLEVRAKTLEHMETIAPQIIGHIRGRSGAMCKCLASERNEQTSISSVQWKSAIYIFICMYVCIVFFYGTFKRASTKKP